MKSLLLAGGLGKRLKDLLNERPKVMAPIGEHPFLEFLILQLRKWGIKDIVICLGYLGSQIKEYFGTGSQYGVRIYYSEEQKPLGTGGAIKLAAEYVNEEDFLVMNGDSFLDIDINAFIAYHRSQQAKATMALVEIDDTSRFGKVEINENGEVLNFAEKGVSGSGLINGGIYVFNRKILHQIPNSEVSLEHEIFPQLIGQAFFGMPVKGFFIDIGIPDDYRRLQSQGDILSKIVGDCEMTSSSMIEGKGKNICPLCESYSLKPVRLYHTALGKRFEKLVCKQCGLVQLCPMLTEEEIERLYSSNYFKKDYHCQAPKSYQEAISDIQNDFKKRILPLIQLYYEETKGLRALEIGCAGGASLQILRKAGFEVFGVELNPQIAEWGKKHLDVNIMIGDLKKQCFPDAHFSVIYMGDILEHICKPVELLSEIRRVASERAILIIDIPFELNAIAPRIYHGVVAPLLFTILKYERKSAFPPYHVFVYNPKTLKLMLKKTGFEALMLRQMKVLRLLSWKAIFDAPNFLLTKIFKVLGDRATIVAQKIITKG